MKEGTPQPHPGPFRTMKVDAEVAGILVAVGFFVMGFVSVPIAKGFLIGSFGVGIVVATAMALFRRIGNSRAVETKILHIDEK